MSYGIFYNESLAQLEASNGNAMHILTDAEKNFFRDKGFVLCDFKWGWSDISKIYRYTLC